MTYVLYHSECYDGFGAAWAARRALGKQAVYLPVSYGQPVPDVPDGSDIFIVDFSYSRTELEVLQGRAKRLIILDHHQSAKEALEGFPGAVFDLSKSGAILAWEHFHPNRPIPTLLRYIQAADLWQWESLPFAKEITAWLRSYPRDFVLWDKLIEDFDQYSIDKYLTEGTAILRFQSQKVQEIADNVSLHTWGTYPNIPIVNTACLMSETAHELLLRYPDAPFAVYYFIRSDGRIQFGLRSRKDFDCSMVAKEFGGGGHPQASGFIL